MTGGAGFVGSALVRTLVRETGHTVVDVDKLTYAGNLESHAEVEGSPRYRFERADVADAARVRAVLGEHRPSAVLHLAAESGPRARAGLRAGALGDQRPGTHAWSITGQPRSAIPFTRTT